MDQKCLSLQEIAKGEGGKGGKAKKNPSLGSIAPSTAGPEDGRPAKFRFH